MSVHAPIDLDAELGELIAICAMPGRETPLAALDRYCGAIMLTLLRRTEALAPLDSDRRAICTYLESCLAGDVRPGRAALWSPAIASLRHKIAAAAQDAALAQLLWTVCALMDAPCDCALRLTAPCTLYHRGLSTELPAGTQMDFARYETGSPDPLSQILRVCRDLPPDASAAMAAQAEATMPRSFSWAAGAEKFAIATRECGADGIDVEIEWPPAPGHGVPGRLLAQATREIGAAYAAIAHNSGDYARWVERLIAGFAITQQASAEDVSNGSYFSRPGLVHCAFPVDSLVLIETLVHEASHQHFMLLNSIVPLVRKNCTEQVYSPIKGRERPLARALFAYHACINIHGYFAGIAEMQGDERVQRDVARDYCDRFSHALGSAKGLTRHGRALRDLLDARL